MKSYLLIESQGAFDAASAPAFLMLARDLAREGSKVEILLIQNGVMPARKGAKADSLAAAMQAGVTVWADKFSMKERALAHDGLSPGVKPAAIGMVADRMADGWNVIWH
jgi:predicted peroxiredoxin